MLASHLPVPIPEPVALGRPDSEYPFAWSIHRWLLGELAGPDTIVDRSAFADSMLDVIHGLRKAPIDGAPPPPIEPDRWLSTTKARVRQSRVLQDLIDAKAALKVWETGLAAAPHRGALQWVHGDLEGNCLVLNGYLGGLVDWGSACVGDPAVDVQVAWSPLLTDESRVRFLRASEPERCRDRASQSHGNPAGVCGAAVLSEYLSLDRRALLEEARCARRAGEGREVVAAGPARSASASTLGRPKQASVPRFRRKSRTDCRRTRNCSWQSPFRFAGALISIYVRIYFDMAERAKIFRTAAARRCAFRSPAVSTMDRTRSWSGAWVRR